MWERTRPLRLLTWNVNFRADVTLNRVLDLAEEHDILALQEVTVEHAPEFVAVLEAAGFRITYEPHAGSYGSMVASRLPACLGENSLTLWPELLAHAVIDYENEPINVLSVHVPNGSGNGWGKIAWLDGLRTVIESLEGPIIVAGDFNEPRFNWLQNGEVVTWGGEPDEAGLYVPYYFDPKSGQSWDASVRWYFDSHRLRHAYWLVYGLADLPETHVSGDVPRCFDHVLVSDHLDVSRHDLRDETRPQFSDHTAVSVDIRMDTHPNSASDTSTANASTPR